MEKKITEAQENAIKNYRKRKSGKTNNIILIVPLQEPL